MDLSAKAFGVLGTTAATAVGLSKVGDLFPVPHNWASWVWFGVAIAGFVAIGAAVFGFTGRLWKVNRPVLMRTNLAVMLRDKDIDEDELGEVERVFRETAELNGVVSLSAYEAQAQRIARAAARTADKARRAELKAAADRINEEIDVTLARGSLRVLRRRTSKAVRGRGAWLTYAIFVVGLVTFALGTDYVASERSERVTIAKSCADARKAGATAKELPRVCSDPQDDAAGASSAAATKVKLAAGLVKQLQDCTALAAANTVTEADCEGIRSAAQDLLAP